MALLTDDNPLCFAN